MCPWRFASFKGGQSFSTKFVYIFSRLRLLEGLLSAAVEVPPEKSSGREDTGIVAAKPSPEFSGISWSYGSQHPISAHPVKSGRES